MHARRPLGRDHLGSVQLRAANDNVAPRGAAPTNRGWWRRLRNDPALFALYLLLMGAAITAGYSTLGIALWWFG